MRIGEARRKGKCFDIGANTIPFTRENTRLIGMALRQFPTITGEGGRVSSRNRDLGSDGGTMDREIEAVVRPHQILLASKEILCQNNGPRSNFIRLPILPHIMSSQRKSATITYL